MACDGVKPPHRIQGRVDVDLATGQHGSTTINARPEIRPFGILRALGAGNPCRHGSCSRCVSR
jgi:hypothetical protein